MAISLIPTTPTRVYGGALIAFGVRAASQEHALQRVLDALAHIEAIDGLVEIADSTGEDARTLICGPVSDFVPRLIAT